MVPPATSREGIWAGFAKAKVRGECGRTGGKGRDAGRRLDRQVSIDVGGLVTGELDGEASRAGDVVPGRSDSDALGLVVGTVPATPLGFSVGLAPGQYAQLDDVVVTRRELPGSWRADLGRGVNGLNHGPFGEKELFQS